jgi:hypothetical protein
VVAIAVKYSRLSVVARFLQALVLVAAACSSDPPATRATGGERYGYPPPGGEPATCRGASTHIVRAMAAAEGSDKIQRDTRAGIELMCRDERWSDECLRCMVAGTTMREVAGCETLCRR